MMPAACRRPPVRRLGIIDLSIGANILFVDRGGDDTGDEVVGGWVPCFLDDQGTRQPVLDHTNTTDRSSQFPIPRYLRRRRRQGIDSMTQQSASIRGRTRV